MPLRTGIVALVVILKHMCHLLGIWRVSIDAVLSSAVTGGQITAAQKTTVDNFLDAAQAACDVVRVVTGY